MLLGLFSDYSGEIRSAQSVLIQDPGGSFILVKNCAFVFVKVDLSEKL